VVYYQDLGFSGAQIGLLTGISPLVTFFGAPLWTRMADSTRRHRLILSMTMGFGIAALCAFPLLSAFAPILIASLLLSFFLAPTSSLADNATMHMLGEKKEMYGRVRLGGTIGYAVAAPLAGLLIQNTSLRTAFWVSGFLYFLALLCSLNFDHGPAPERPASGGGTRTLLADPHWVLFLGIAFAGGLSLTAANNYLFPYMKELGADESIMGISLSIGTVFEYPVLFFGNRLIRLFKPYGLFMLAMAATGLRLVLFGVNSSPDAVLLIQLLNGFSFPAMWMAGVAYAHERAPKGLSATAQGLLGAIVFGIGQAAGGFLGGPLLETIGGRGLFLLYGCLTLAVTAAGAVIRGFLPKENPAGRTVETAAGRQP
jgi:PPP family 3-phenylpropionic acid transporter